MTPPPSIAIRPYAERDWDDLQAIHDRARLDELRNSVDPSAFLSLARTAESEGLFAGEVLVAVPVAGKTSSAIGFVAFAGDEVTWLYVHPDHYRRGIGRCLLEAALDQCGPVVTTEVLAGNEAAIALYLDAGFTIVETVDGVLEGNESYAVRGHRMTLDRRSVDPADAAGT